MILNKIARKICRGPTNKFKLVLDFFLGIYLGFIWQNIIFIQNKIIKIGLRVCYPNNPLGQKFLNKKVTNQTKPRYLTKKKTNHVDLKTLVQSWTEPKIMVWLETLSSTINRTKDHWFDLKRLKPETKMN